MPFLRLPDADLFYRIAGQGGPAFVLVHGGMCDHHDWDGVVPALAVNHTTLAVDLRAHGGSGGDVTTFRIERCAADLNRLIDELGLAPAILVGHSFAARIVAEAGYTRPDNAAGLILLDGSRAYGGLAASVNTGGPMGVDLAQAIETTIGPYLTGKERARVVETMSAASLPLMAASVAEIARWDRDRADLVFAGLLDGLPVLAIQSTYHDAGTPRRSLDTADASTPYLDLLRGVLPGLGAHVLADTGHFSMIERSAAIVDQFTAFVDICDRYEQTRSTYKGRQPGKAGLR